MKLYIVRTSFYLITPIYKHLSTSDAFLNRHLPTSTHKCDFIAIRESMPKFSPLSHPHQGKLLREYSCTLLLHLAIPSQLRLILFFFSVKISRQCRQPIL